MEKDNLVVFIVALVAVVGIVALVINAVPRTTYSAVPTSLQTTAASDTAGNAAYRPPGEAVPYCGDNNCLGGETCSTCPQDCGYCKPIIQPRIYYCGDGSCNNGETCSTCAQDCGSCSTLTSNFLKNDITAQAIVKGTTTAYSINEFGLNLIGTFQAGNTDTFAFKTLSALMQLGYADPVLYTPYLTSYKPAQVILNHFQRNNNFPESDIITKQTLLKIDAQLTSREKTEKTLADAFPLLATDYVQAPNNWPGLDHMRYVVSLTLQSLPSNLVIWNNSALRDFYMVQYQSVLNISLRDRPIVTGNFYPVYPGFVYPQYDPTPTNQLISLPNDFSSAVVVLHEYAHYLDGNSLDGGDHYISDWGRPGTAKGLIDTTGFRAISFYPNGTTKIPTKYDSVTGFSYREGYISGYAGALFMGANTVVEDWAESFAAYIMEGKVFRDKAQTDPILKQKYDWLKTHVFNGVEYNTGNANWRNIPSYSPASTEYNSIQGNVQMYSTNDPTFVWDYQINKLN